MQPKNPTTTPPRSKTFRAKQWAAGSFLLLNLLCLNILIAEDQDPAQTPQPRSTESAAVFVAPVDPNDTPLSQEELDAKLRVLMESGMQAAEGTGPEDENPNESAVKRKLKEAASPAEWIKKFNYKQILLRVLRWSEQKSADPKSKEHVANIAALLLTSHTIETIGGLVMINTGIASDHIWAKTLGPTIGAAIMTPGLDPLCYILGITYFAMPSTMGKIVYVPRIFIMKSSAFLYKYLGVKRLMNLLLTEQSAVNRLRKSLSKREGTFDIIELPDSIKLQIGSKKNPQLLTLYGKIKDKQITWEAADLSVEAENIRERRILTQKLKGLTWVTRESLKQLLETSLEPAELKSMNFVESYHETERGLYIRFIESSLSSKSNRTLNPYLRSAASNIAEAFRSTSKKSRCAQNLASKNP
ncbi:MAG: hypothetical protein R3A80_01610 [Bdellovibrionota bacterium]